MAIPAAFNPMSATVLPSQEKEILVARQSALRNQGNHVRAAMSKLPPSVVDSILHEYKSPNEQTLQEVFVAVAENEHILDSARKGQNLDLEWLQNGGQTMRRMDEVGLSENDSWNDGPSIS